MRRKNNWSNKGFSLVELIVVIAIMAVLVGLMAPTLIKNVEKSRESVDIQTLDSVRQSVVTALSNEKVYSEFLSESITISAPHITYMDDIKSATTGLNGELSKELDDDGVLTAKFNSNACKNAKIKITISADSKVKVEAENAGITKSNINMVVE